MFDTYVTIVGNVLTAPEWRRTTQSNTLVANFKVASTARRLDRDSGRWVDGNSLRVRVNCWRKLAEGVAASVMVGDPVVVCGRLYTRDWTDDAGNHRTLYELEAVAVGHDLSRGRARFLRNRPSMTTSTVEDAEAEQPGARRTDRAGAGRRGARPCPTTGRSTTTSSCPTSPRRRPAGQQPVLRRRHRGSRSTRTARSGGRLGDGLGSTARDGRSGRRAGPGAGRAGRPGARAVRSGGGVGRGGGCRSRRDPAGRGRRGRWAAHRSRR